MKKRERLLVGCSGKAATNGGKADGSGRDWSGLPEPAVFIILDCLLPAVADVFSLGSVCKAWRSVLVACRRELFSALPPFLVDGGSSPSALGGFYSFMEERFYRPKQRIPFPWVQPGGGDFLMPDAEIVGASHGYWIVRCGRTAAHLGETPERPVFLMDPLFSPGVRINLPPSPPITYASMTAPPTSADCLVVATYLDRTLYCRPGDEEWVHHSFKDGGGDSSSNYGWMKYASDLVVVLGRKVYALARNGKLVVMELLFPRPSVTVLNVGGLPPEGPRPIIDQLVESDGEILYIAYEGWHKWELDDIPLPHGTPCREEHRYVVCRLDLLARKWVTVHTLGGRSVFVNRGFPVTVGATVAARWGGGGDCIYSFCPSSGPLLVFHIKDGRVEHHPMPIEHRNQSIMRVYSYGWLIPSACY